jgi:hypothetical protein
MPSRLGPNRQPNRDLSRPRKQMPSQGFPREGFGCRRGRQKVCPCWSALRLVRDAPFFALLVGPETKGRVFDPELMLEVFAKYDSSFGSLVRHGHGHRQRLCLQHPKGRRVCRDMARRTRGASRRPLARLGPQGRIGEPQPLNRSRGVRLSQRAFGRGISSGSILTICTGCVRFQTTSESE